MLADPLGLVEQTLLDRYYIDAPIARGGMGVVYRGRDLRLLRPVCIKIFHRPGSNDAVYRASYDHFVREAFALSRLSHPNTLRIYDFGHLQDGSGAPFHVSELLEGGTLGQWIRHEGPRSAAEALGLIAPIAGALGEAHGRGIIHRDVKPSNIILALVGRRRVPKLGDFGIAKAPTELGPVSLHGDDAALAPAVRLYSSGWAAPEQRRGEPAAPTTDVFALGLVTAFVLAGRPVFTGRHEGEVLLQECEHDAHVVDRLFELALAPDLIDVIQTACRAEPCERYGSTDEFVTALSRAVHAVSTQRPLAAAAHSAGGRELDSGVQASLLARGEIAPPAAPALQATGGSRSSSAPVPAAGSPAPGTRESLRNAAGSRAADLFVDCAQAGELTLLGRRLTVLGLHDTAPLDLGGESWAAASKARFRVTLLPSRLPGTRINLRGLNCFVAPAAGRPATAVNLEDDTELELVSSDRKPLDRLTCSLGRGAGSQHLYRVGPLTVAIAGAATDAVLLDFGPGREFVLIHAGTRAQPLGDSA